MLTNKDPLRGSTQIKIIRLVPVIVFIQVILNTLNRMNHSPQTSDPISDQQGSSQKFTQKHLICRSFSALNRFKTSRCKRWSTIKVYSSCLLTPSSKMKNRKSRLKRHLRRYDQRLAIWNIRCAYLMMTRKTNLAARKILKSKASTPK